MNLIDQNNVNIQKMYKYQLDEMSGDEYSDYIKYLTIFYQKNHKKDKFDKEFIDGKYILIDKSNPSKKITITPSQFVDIHKLYIELKNYSDLILFKISNLIENKNNITEDDRKEFDSLKVKYVSAKNKLKDIDLINTDFYDKIDNLITKKIEKSNELAKYYQQRNETYNSIQTMISENVKNNLIKIFKENKNKIPPLKDINKIAKSNNIPSNDIEKWFKWIEIIYFYIIINQEINKITLEIDETENNFYKNTKYMIIKKPIIEKK